MPFLCGFQREILNQWLTEDSLLVLARGLHLKMVLATAMHLYKTPEALVLVLNLNETESDIDEITELWSSSSQSFEGVNEYFHKIGASVTKRERASLYVKGGVFCISARILVVDMLRKNIPIHLITGIIVANAHQVHEHSIVNFILRLFRAENKEGFIKGITENPESLTFGFAKLEKTLRNLYLKQVFFWPRFHMSISGELDQTATAEVIELSVPLTENMKEIQYGLLGAIDKTVQELKRSHPSLTNLDIFNDNNSNANANNLFFSAIDVLVRIHLNSVWSTVGNRTRELVQDLKVLRNLLEFLVNYDCISFYEYLDTLLTTLTSSNEGERDTSWLLLDEADTIFKFAKRRIFERSKSGDFKAILEENPKWNCLKQVIEEIRETLDSHENEKVSKSVTVVFCRDSKSLHHFQNYILHDGARNILAQSFKRHMKWKEGKFSSQLQQFLKGTNSFASNGNATTARPSSAGKRRRISSAETAAQQQQRLPSLADLDQEFADLGSDDEDASFQVSQFDKNFGILKDGHRIIFAIANESENFWLLEDLKPNFIVMTEPNLVLIRQIELHQARNKEKGNLPLSRIYLLMYETSIEEQRYLTVVRKEKDSFETLIKEKANMAVAVEQDGKFTLTATDKDSLIMEVGDSRLLSLEDGEDQDVIQKVVVDIREFRSSLPSVLHANSFEIMPCTIEIGDYVLSPKHCVERKTIPDLIGSFTSGRLYDQASAMQSAYELPFLLLEFDPDLPFVNQSLFLNASIATGNSISGGMNEATYSKLILLIIHFPKLRLLWSPFPKMTTEYFTDIKKNNDQPTKAEAMSRDKSFQNGALGKSKETTINLIPKEMLLAIDGVNSSNYSVILEHVNSLIELVQVSLEDLIAWIGAKDGTDLHQFLHSNNKK